MTAHAEEEDVDLADVEDDAAAAPVADIVLERQAEADAEYDAKVEALHEAAAARPQQEEGESTADYVRRLRELQVAETRTRR